MVAISLMSLSKIACCCSVVFSSTKSFWRGKMYSGRLQSFEAASVGRSLFYGNEEDPSSAPN